MSESTSILPDRDPFRVRLTGRGGEVSLRQQVSDALVAGTLIPGKIYSAPAIAEMLGVSPTPVREAMINLSREELVEALRNKGYLINGFSDRDCGARSVILHRGAAPSEASCLVCHAFQDNAQLVRQPPVPAPTASAAVPASSLPMRAGSYAGELPAARSSMPGSCC